MKKKIIIAIAVIVILAAGGFFYMNHKVNSAVKDGKMFVEYVCKNLLYGNACKPTSIQEVFCCIKVQLMQKRET